MTVHVKMKFGEFEYDPASGDLAGPAGTIRLHDKPGQVLQALAAHEGEVVTRDALQKRLWPEDTHVDFSNNLNAAVKRLRDALGDQAADPHYVETIPRKGYRLIVPVEMIDLVQAPPSPEKEEPHTANREEEEQVPVPPEPTAPPPTQADAQTAAPNPARTKPRRRSRGPWPYLTVSLVLVVLGVAAFWRGRATVANPPEGKIMLAVLPFQNYTGDARENDFADGLTEELITHLGRLQPERLGVISRISAMTYRDAPKTIAEIGQELGVHYILEGSLRRSGNRGRITAQLIQVADQTHLWAENYDFEPGDMLAIQDRVAHQVAKTLTLELLDGAMPAIARASLADTRAYHAFLRGRNAWFQFNGDAYLRAVAHFEEALTISPDAAIVYAGLADTYNLLAFTSKMNQAEAFELAKSTAHEGLQRDPDSAEAHNALAFALLYHDRDFVQSEFHFRKAVDLNPGFAMAYHWYAGLLSARNRHDEAIAAMETSLRLDPVSLSLRSDLGWYFLFADRPEEAVTAFKETLARNEHYGWAMGGLAQAYFELGLYKQACYTLRKSLHLDGWSETETAFLDGPNPRRAWFDALSVQKEKRLREVQGDPSGYALEMAMYCAQLGSIDEAFTWLDQAHADTWLVFLEVDPRLDRLHADPRFRPLANSLGLNGVFGK
ncbi:Winged helix-turn-helix domain-containing protein [Sulfidibacter corallicola]|uniref:Winged helix-turn-helix domain-containing protein n=1 Tax=Sulfidibacter corallicola TaxID=2818388 RepID=A0A8A4TFS0_SULCO|nr:winged helix-turn-helix domain-containing protein [Sulfidibacter corallicola]QTD48400.1 winged helix-turn-helix domain-containing protein [Sulfidibacter corallicola]